MNTSSSFVQKNNNQLTNSPARKKRQHSDDHDNPKLVAKRAKAAERQRRKRERDRRSFQEHRVAAAAQWNTQAQDALPNQDGNVAIAPAQDQLQDQQQDVPPIQTINGQEPIHVPGGQVMQHTQPDAGPSTSMTSEEESKRERVRAAARDRQRKHRALVKRKKLMELGVQMGEGGLIPEELTYTLGPDGQYTPSHPPQTGDGSLQGMPGAENGFLPNSGAQSTGQKFVNFVFLALSCSPLIKSHLLNEVHMTNEDLVSLEPVLCAAFEQWDHHRREAFAAEQMKMQGGSEQQPDQPGESAGASSSNTHTFAAPSSTETAVSNDDSTDPTDFRTRFHRSLVAPSPFSTVAAGNTSSSSGTVNANETRSPDSILQAAAAQVATIDPRLPIGADFVQYITKLASQTVNGTVKHMSVENEANENAEVEKELDEEQQQANGQ